MVSIIFDNKCEIVVSKLKIVWNKTLTLTQMTGEAYKIIGFENILF